MNVIGSLSTRASASNLYGGGGAASSLLDLDLHVGNRGARPGKVGRAGVGVLGVVVRDGRLDGVLSKHGAVHCVQVSELFPESSRRVTYA